MKIELVVEIGKCFTGRTKDGKTYNRLLCRIPDADPENKFGTIDKELFVDEPLTPGKYKGLVDVEIIRLGKMLPSK